jgi:hypothetical protein
VLAEQGVARVLVGRHEPAVEPAFADRVLGSSGLRERGCQQDQESPFWLAEVQRGCQRRVGVQHDVDVPRELVAGEVERDVRGDIGEHLGFEDDRYSVGGYQCRRDGWSASSPGGSEIVSMAAEVQDGGSHPRGLPSQLHGKVRKLEAPAGRKQVRENDLSGADRGGLPL